jgi:hypothetical protein
MEFQYLHVLILSTKSQPQQLDLRVSSARKAITLLPSLVSNSGQLYNGVVWQLLYYPLSPFLVVFKQILEFPANGEVAKDLEYLSITVNYFLNMKAQLSGLARIAGQIAETAEALYRLAQRRVDATPNTGLPNRRDPLDLDADVLMSWLPDDTQIGFPPTDSNSAMNLNEILFSHVADVSEQESGIGVRPEAVWGGLQPFDSMFDWFSWDTYYATGQN